MAEHGPFSHKPAHDLFDHERAQRLNNSKRLKTQVGEQDLARLLALRGDEDLIDLGSGTGFYTDVLAGLTTGTVYAVELQPEMSDHYRERGVPANVRLVSGDITRLSLKPASADGVCCIATWHETGGEVDLAGLAQALRPEGRLVVIDWRRDPESWEDGPPADIRFTKEEVAAALAPYFTPVVVENLGCFMFAVVATLVGSA